MLSTNFTNSLTSSFDILAKQDKLKILAVACIQVISSLLDLVGVAIIGILGALTVAGIQSSQPDVRIQDFLNYIGIGELSFQNQAAILGCIAALFLLAKTLFSFYFLRRTLRYLSFRGAKISSDLISKLLNQNLLQINSRTTQETIFAVTTGVSLLMLGVIGTFVGLVSDTALLIILTVGLIYINPVIAICTILLFLLVGIILYKALNQKAQHIGLENTALTIKSNEMIAEILQTYREAFLRNRRSHYAAVIGSLRFKLGGILAENAFMPYIGKYVIESTLILGALLLSASQFYSSDASQAVGTLAVFLSAATRIAPAALRIQQGSLQIRNNLAATLPTRNLINELQFHKPQESLNFSPQTSHLGFSPDVLVRDLSFTYPNQEKPSLVDFSCDIPAGSFISIVGKSGAGKTTLADCLLGILPTKPGKVLISGISPRENIDRWPGAIAYVPQDVAIVAGSVIENIALGFDLKYVDTEMVYGAIKKANLMQFLATLPEGIYTELGERGTRLSGGQRQRIGIARALFTNPKLIVLDEATSSLDGESEAQISETLQNLRGQVTLIIIAHRLSTVRTSDQILYMEAGHLRASAKFEDLRKLVPEFDQQAILMGL